MERLFAANLPAKYWVTGSLDMTDSIVNTEFYDAGPVSVLQNAYVLYLHVIGYQAYSSSPFVPLSELANLPLSKNQPIITANMIAKPGSVASTTPNVGVVPEQEAPITTVLDDGLSNTSISSGSRKGSRMHTSRT
jgi:hypothetical protein